MSGSNKKNAGRLPLAALLLLFLAAFASRAVFPDTSYFFWDESVYLLHGQLFAGQEVGYSEAFLRPPLLSLLLSPFARLDSYELASRFLLAFLNSLVVFPVFFLTAAVFSRSAAFIAAALAAFLPVHILNSRWVLTDALGALLAFSAVAAFVFGFLLQRKMVFFFALGGLLAGLAVLMKFTNLLLIALLPPLLILAVARRRFSAVAAGLLLFVIVLAPFLAYSQIGFGSLFYTFERAFHVVAESDSLGFGFFVYLLLDSLGVLLVFLVFGIARIQLAKLRLYLVFCLLAAGAYSFFIVGRGVSKPFGVEWEAGRFLLLFLLFALPFIGNGIYQFVSYFGRCFSFPAAASAVVLVSLLLMYPQFARSYAPALGFEGGLRAVAKEAGLYLRGSSMEDFACLGNCPPVAYYSGKKMSVYYSAADLAAANHSSVVVFGSSGFFPSYRVVEEFCSGSHCAYLMRLQ